MAARGFQAASLLLAALVLACGGEPPPEPSRAHPVTVLVVPDEGLASTTSYPGRAEAAREVDLNFQVDGRMLERKVALGDRVEAGQVLARLDPRDFSSELARAQATSKQASTRLLRVREAAEIGAVSRQELTEAEAQAEQARAAVQIRRKALEDATLRAPFAGTVTATYVEALQQVKEGDPILRLLDASKIEIWVNVPENRIDRARSDPPVVVRFDALPGREYIARLLEVGNEADEQTRTFPVSLLIEQTVAEGEEGWILPGMAGEATPQLPPDAALARSGGPEVPLSAVFSDTASPSFVWIVAEGRAERREVETGPLTDVGIVVSQGLQPGERIVVRGGQFLDEGAEVKVVESGGTAS